MKTIVGNNILFESMSATGACCSLHQYIEIQTFSYVLHYNLLWLLKALN